MIKTRSITIFTGIAFLAVIALQSIWLNSTYRMIGNDAKKTLDKIIPETIQKEVYYRLEHDRKYVPRGTKFYGVSPNEDPYTIAVYFNKTLTNFNLPLNLSRLDSFMRKDLSSGMMLDNYSIERADKKGKILG